MVSSAKPVRADSRQTRADILQASVRLFAEHGFAGTSMRSIADAAGVNLASMNYHFGSKAQLFSATFQHCAAPINAQRMQRLEALVEGSHVPTVADIVRVFVDAGEIGDADWSRLVAHVFVEPDAFAKPILEQTFAPTVARFLEALGKALPQLAPEVLAIRFHLLVGSMLHLVRFDTPLGVKGKRGKLASQKNNIDELVNFVVAGLCQTEGKI